MKKLQYTPGPWFVDSGLIINNGISDISMIFIGDIDNSEEIEKSKTDARLIAAAPEMLDALIMVKKHGHSGYIEGSKADIEFWFKINNAIEKATGLTIGEVLSE